jgi:hypothetical protein
MEAKLVLIANLQLRTCTIGFGHAHVGTTRGSPPSVPTPAVRWQKLSESSLCSPAYSPSDPALVAAQRAAETAASWPPPILLLAEVWTDGSCIMPTDPLLRRAAWAVVGYPERGYPTLARAQVIGRQSIGRAELSAVVWVSMCMRGNATSIVDAQ